MRMRLGNLLLARGEEEALEARKLRSGYTKEARSSVGNGASCPRVGGKSIRR
jgi:hypothetical protein